MTSRVDMIIEGRVQGVGFRHFTLHHANELGISGSVKNRPDGTVSVIAEGEEEALLQFIAYLKQGPAMSHVSQIRQDWKEATQSFSDFNVEF
jgi:acylphosphatase